LSGTKIHSPVPYFLLAALFAAVPVLNNQYTAFFFPAISFGWIEVISIFSGVATAIMGFTRGWNILQRRERVKVLVLEALENRHVELNPEPNDVIIAGRNISRLIRNADEDLKEIKPDFSMNSLSRLEHYLPQLMAEIENEEDALIRVGIVGTYLGETLCRNLHWQWFFKSDTALRQFSYLVSVIRWQGKDWDPYVWAADLMVRKRRVKDILKEVHQPLA